VKHMSWKIAMALGVLGLLASACSSTNSSSHSAHPSSSSSSSSSPASTSSTFYKINTSNCPDPAKTKQKISGTLTVGWSGPLSGPIAPFVDSEIQGFKDRFAYQNAHGGIGGVQLAVTAKDDQFNPALTKANVDSFIQAGNIDVIDMFGSGNLAAVAADQNLACVPLLFANATDDTYRNISQYPWTTEYLPSNNVEETAEAQEIEAAFPGQKTITIAVAEDQTGSGASYLAGMQYAVKGTNMKIVSVVPFNDPNSAAIALKAANPDVVFGALVVPECLEMTEAIAKLGWTPKMVVQASNCASASLMFAPAGQAANGQRLVYWSIGDPTASTYAGNAGVQSFLTESKSVDPSAQVANTYYQTGWIIAGMDINVFKTAAASSLGLSEAGIMQAARNQDYHPSLFYPGVNWVMNAKEAYGMMALQPLKYDNATQSFVDVGPLINTCPKILGAGNCPDGL